MQIKHVQNLQVKIFESCYFSYAWVKMVKKVSILAQTLSTISLVIFKGCVRLFFVVSFIYIYLVCVCVCVCYYFFNRWGWLVGLVIEYV